MLTGALENATGIRLDPPLTHNFLISLINTSSVGAAIASSAMSLVGDVLFGGFSEASGLDMSMEITKKFQGGQHGQQLIFPNHLAWGNITLKKGVSRIFQTGWDWLYAFGDGKVKRMDGVILLMDSQHIPHNLWYFKNGLPAKYTGPNFNAKANDVAIETLEIAHEGLWQLSISALGTQALGAMGVNVP